MSPKRRIWPTLVIWTLYFLINAQDSSCLAAQETEDTQRPGGSINTSPSGTNLALPGAREVTTVSPPRQPIRRLTKSRRAPGAAHDPRQGRIPGAALSSVEPRGEISTQDIPSALLHLVEELHRSPSEIFAYVHDHFDFDPRWGAAKPPLQTLREKRGTAWELTWLLRDLLAAVGIDARFEWGEVELSPEGLESITGIDDVGRAADLIATGGTPIRLIVENGEVVAVRMRHVWILAYLDYIPNRGRWVGEPDYWVRMGPTFKRYVVDEGARLDDAVPFALGEYLQGGSALSPRDAYEEALQAHLDESSVGVDTIDDVKRDRAPLKEDFVFVPGSLRGYVRNVEGASIGIPAEFLNRLELRLSEVGGRDLLTWSSDLASLYAKPLELAWVGASAADQAALDLSGGVFAAPPYEVELAPKLRLGDVEVAAGGEVGSASDVLLTAIVTSPGGEPITTEFAMLAGEHGVLAADLGLVPEEVVDLYAQRQGESADARDIERWALAHASALYLRELGKSNAHLSGLRWQRLVNLGNVVLAVQRGAVSRSPDGTPLTFSPAPPALDLGAMTLALFPPAGDPASASAAVGTLELLGAHASTLEAEVWTQVHGGEHVSAVLVLTRAAREGQILTHVDTTNLETALATAELSAAAEASVELGVRQGLIAWIPAAQIPLITATGTWDVTGYILENPATGAAGFLTTYERLLTPLDAEITFHSPVDLDSITAPTEIVATVAGEEVESWRLTSRPLDGGPQSVLAEGTGAFTNAVLGRFDPTLLANGLHELVLTARGANDRSASKSVHVLVEGGMKIGNFALTFLDFTIPLAGLDLRVARTYDSRDRNLQGDFGYGWTLGLRRGSYRNNRPPGAGWQITSNLLPCETSNELQTHVTVIRLSETEIYRFRPTLGRLASQQGGCEAQVSFDLIAGALPGATLEILGNPRVFYENGGDRLIDLESNELFEPRRVRLRTVDGRIFDLDLFEGVTRLETLDGASLTLDADGLAHSSGLGVRFERDSEDRIERIIDPAGHAVTYSYDLDGNLENVTDPEGYVTTFTYHEGHLLATLIDPTGVEAQAMGYTEDGRLTSICQGAACAQITHDLEGREESRTDATGRRTTWRYDERGNVTSVTDALGNTTEYEYVNDRLTLKRDPLGNETVMTYTEAGTLKSRRAPVPEGADPAAYTTYFTHNARRQLTSVTLPTGAVLHYDYDELGRQTQLRDNAGRVVESSVYGSGGTVLEDNDLVGTLTYEDLTPAGSPRRIVDTVFDTVITATYDELDNLLTVDDGEVSSSFTYDRRGRELRMERSDGSWSEKVYGHYDAWTEIRGPNGILGRRFHPRTGQLAGWDLENGASVSYGYDLAGRLNRVVDAGGGITRIVHDEVGRPKTITAPNGGVTEQLYDPAGRITETLDAEGYRWLRSYTVDGRLATRTNPRQHTWSYRYGRTHVEVEDPLSRVSRVELTPHGNPWKVIFADGRSVETEYLSPTLAGEDDGLPTRVIDEGGRVRDFGYNALGQHERATDLGGAVYTYTWNGSDLEALTAPTGEAVMQFTYNALDLLETKTYADGGTYVFDYDEAARLKTLTLPSGVTTTRTYDGVGRLETSRSSLGESTALTWTSRDEVKTLTDATGTTTHHYDILGNLEAIEHSSGSRVDYGRDLLGRVIRVTVRATSDSVPQATHYRYDPAGNLDQITDPLGGVTALEWDAVNRLVRRVLPNGVVSEWAYNLRDQVSSVIHRGPDGTVLASREYIRDAVGEPSRIVREDGSVLELTYDAALRVETERFLDASGNEITSQTYGYDLAGSRRTVTTPSGLETYTYTPGMHLTDVAGPTESQSYSYDSDGQVSQIERDGASWTLSYDADGHLRQVADTTTGAELASYTYDGLGRRLGLQDGSGGRRLVTVPVLGDGLESPHLVVNETGEVLAGYVYMGQTPLMRWGPDGPVYYLSDSMGSVIALADGNGSAVSRFAYDSFGNRAPGSTDLAPDSDLTAGGDFRFHGAWRDTATGLYDMRARTYDPRTGRFLSRDPAEASLVEPESMHPYVFAHGNPHLYQDPTGLFSIASINVTLSVKGVLQAARSWAVRQIVGEIREAAAEVAVNWLVKILQSMIPMTGEDFFDLAATFDDPEWRQYEAGVQNFLCNTLRLNAPWLRFEPVIRETDGDPLGNGWGCQEERDPNDSVDRFKKGHREPDFVVHPQGKLVQPPVNRSKKPVKGAYMVGEIKLGISTFYSTYVRPGRRSGQLAAIVRYSVNHSVGRFSLLVALRDNRKKWAKDAILRTAEGFISDDESQPRVVLVGIQ